MQRRIIRLNKRQYKLKKVKYLSGAKTGEKENFSVVTNYFLQLILLQDYVQTRPINFLRESFYFSGDTI